MRKELYIISFILVVLVMAAYLREPAIAKNNNQLPVETETTTEVTTELLLETTIETTAELPEVVVIIPEAETTTEPEPVSLGEFKLTAYCSCSKCCGKWAKDRPVDEYGNEIVYGASGAVLKAGYSIAVDPTVIPYGTILIINGKEYEAQDCGGAIKNKRIDVYFDSHEEALIFGVQTAEVFIKEVSY